MKKYKSSKLYIRAVCCCFVLTFCMFVCLMRILSLASDSTLYYAAVAQNTISVGIYKERGKILDTNKLPLTSAQQKTVSVIPPTPKGVIALSEILSGDEYNEALKRLYAGRPIVVEGECISKTLDILTVKVPVRYSDNQIARHLVGYLNHEQKGVSGIEQGLDEKLSGGDINAVFSCDAKGGILQGDAPGLYKGGQTPSDVVLTIDSRIQTIVENALTGVVGAAVVMEVGGDIRAMASYPQFDQNNISESLNSEESPFLNRTLSAYNIGSIFKPIVAATSLDSGILPVADYFCNGRLSVGGKVFNCHNRAGHGVMDLKAALGFSCNTYFYNLAAKVGGIPIIDTVKLLGFGSAKELGGGIKSVTGRITSEETLQNPAAVANLAIGQGDLMATPIDMLTLYEAIATDGTYSSPRVLEGYMNNGKFKAVEQNTAKIRAMSRQSAATIKEFLIEALNIGTGVSAKPDIGVAGGKTATAESGWLVNGQKINQGWLCGFLVCDEKTYIISILVQSVQSGSKDCAPVFKTICERITELMSIKS